MTGVAGIHDQNDDLYPMSISHPSRTPRANRVLVIHNPMAGRGHSRLFQDVTAALERLGCDVAIQTTTQRGDAEAFARSADPETFDVAVAAGGDGVIAEVVNGLLANDVGDHDLPLGIIPLGTANVLAMEIALPADAYSLARIIAAGPRRCCYPGLANGRAFMMMAGAGFDAHVVNNVSSSLKKRIGKGAYVWAALCELMRRNRNRFDVVTGGRTISAASVIVSKGRYYGGHYICTPDSRLDRPTFQVCLFERSGTWATLRYLLGLVRGAIPRMQGVTLIETDALRIEGRHGDPVQGDGDIIANLPLDVRVAERGLLVLAPD